MKRRVAIVLSLVALSGCDKLKSMSGGADGGTTGSSSPSILGEIFGTDFEGEVTMKVTEASQPNKPQTIVWGIKKPEYRMDMTDGSAMNASLIVNPTTKKGWLLMHPAKTAMAIDLNQLANMRAPNIPGMPSTPKGVPTTAPTTLPTIDKTGKKDTIAGYTCEIWNITSGTSKSQVCMADNLTWIDLSAIGVQSPEGAALAAATSGNHFPLRMISYAPNGTESAHIEAQKIEKKTLSDSEFAPPADYKQMNLGQFPGMPNMPAHH